IAPHFVSIAYEITRSQQQVQEVEGTVSCFQRVVAVDGTAELVAKECRKVGVRVSAKLVEREKQRLLRGVHVDSRHTFAVRGPTALSCASEVSIAGQVDQRGFGRIE